MFSRPLLVSTMALLCLHLHAQSLGEIARRQQQKKQPANIVLRKVLTNDDMAAVSSTTSAGSNPSATDKGTSASPSKDSTAWTAEKFRSEIQKQRDAIAETQNAIDKIEPTINHVQNNRNIYTNAPEYNAHQDEKQQTVNQLKGRLAEQQSELADLQEKARKAGYGNSVYQ